VRIAQVIARLNVGGTARWLEVLTSELQKQGHEVMIFTGNVQSGEVEDQATRTLPVHKIASLGRAVSPFDDLRALSEIRSALREFRPDVVNTHTAKAGTLGRLASRSLRNRPAIAHTVHGHLIKGYFNPLIVKSVTGVERAMAGISDLVFAAGTQVGEELIQAGTVPRNKLRIVMPGVPDDKHLSREESFSQLHVRNHELVKDRVVVGWLARIVPVKGPDRLLDVARANPDVLFLVGGDGSERERIESLAPDNVNFVGWTTPDVFWAACDIGLLTSFNEAVPYSIIEASLAGIPVVSTDVGSVREMIEDGVTGIIVAEEPDAMNDAIGLLSGHKDDRERMGSQARALALSKFTPQAMGDRHSELYEEALRIRWGR
jgi:glycosyltransferase involved in cell wall biosynthesis